MAAPKSWQQTQSLRPYMPSVTLMVNNTSSLMPSWIKGRIPMWPSLGRIRSRSLMVRRLSNALPEVGSCVVSERMAELLGRNCLKESHPLQVAEFALAAGIANESAFNWWVTWVLKKRDRIISLVKHQSTRYNQLTHKFGIELPKSVDEAYTVNKAIWCDVIELEMRNVRVAYDVSLMVLCHHKIINS
ncbi:LOW QUALITY PROTEIN: hypothetical protein ACHAW6_001802 [Cyclotella cf. meneghiniana]